MADLNPEVMHELVRLMNGEVAYTELDDDALYALGAAAQGGRTVLHEVTVELRRRGYTFVQMADRWHVDPATPTRWVNPPNRPGRRPRPADNDPDDEQL